MRRAMFAHRARARAGFLGFLVALFLIVAQTGLIAAADDTTATDTASAEAVATTEGGTEANADAPDATSDATATDATGEATATAETADATSQEVAPPVDDQARDSARPITRESSRETAASSSGGNISLDFIAAGPGTYNHETGVGGEYADRTIDKDTGVVESLEGGDFACGDLVVFFTQIAADSDVDGSNDVDIDFSFLEEPTGQPGVGFVDLVSVGLNAGDSGNDNLDGNEAASIESETHGKTGGKDALKATVRVTNINADDVFILRLVVLLGCQVGAHPTGNLQAAVLDASTGDESISVGNQTIPLKKVEDVAFPEIRVIKSCTGSAQIGEDITYTITVENTGNEPLENLVVSDPLLGGTLGIFSDTLGVGDSESHQFTHTVTASDPDPLTNTLTAEADGASSQAHVSDTDSCQADVLHRPEIRVTKSCTGSAQIGEDITYTITVENTGNEPLENLVVSDPLLGGTLGIFSDTLGVGDSESHQFTHTVTASDPDPISNTVTATARGVDSREAVSDTDSCTSDVTHVPGIDVDKTCPTASGIGDTITYEITVRNTGNEPLENLVVSDPLLGGALGSFPSTLPVGGSVTRSFEYTVTDQSPDPLTNTVTATARGVDSRATVQDTANCGLDVQKPAIDLVKDGPDLVHVGDTITYEFTVTNVGDVPLHDVALVDAICDSVPVLVDDGDGNAVLAVDEVWAYTCDHVVTAEDPDPLPNTGTVSGVSPLGETVSDQDDHLVDIIHPAIQIVKTASPRSGEPGDTVTYTYVITNIGDTTLYEVTLDDDILGHLADFADPLEPGESVEFTADVLLTDDSDIVVNVGSTAGTDVLGLTVTDDDPAVVTIVLPEPPHERKPPTAFTGTDQWGLGFLAVGLLVVGALALMASRRREGDARA